MDKTEKKLMAAMVLTLASLAISITALMIKMFL